MKRVFGLVAIGSVLMLAACGGSDSNDGETPAVPVSNVAKRVLISNEFSTSTLGTGRLEIINGDTDAHSGFVINVSGLKPSRIVSTASISVVMNSGSFPSVSVINNATEQETLRLTLGATPEDLVVNPGGTIAYIALRGINTVQAMTVASGATVPVTVPSPQRLVINGAGSRVLAFSADSNSLTIINTADNTTKTVAGFDRPVHAVFRDDNIALVLNCGAECGGTSASVTVLDTSAATPVAGTTVAVSGATVGMIDGGSLYVAGTLGTGGRLDVLNPTTLAVTRTINIGPGLHTSIAAQSGKIFVGARTCANTCLSVADPGAGTAIISSVEGEVTGLQPVSGRSVVYVMQGGELVIYDAATGAPQTRQINIVGNAIGVRQL